MGGLLGVKLRRDLRANAVRFVLMSVAIGVSLTVCAAVLYAWSAVGRETRAAYLGTRPASATILLDEPISSRQATTISTRLTARPEVIAAAGRHQFDSAVRVKGEVREAGVQVFVMSPDDPMQVARFDTGPQPGLGRPGQVLADQGTLSLLRAGIGDTLVIEDPAGGLPLSLTVSGVVYDPSLAPPGQEQRGHLYLSSAAMSGGADPDRPLFDQVKILVAGKGAAAGTASADRAQIMAVAAETATQLRTEYGIGAREIQVPTPGAHPHQFQADVLLLSLLGGGLAALLLSAVLVATMLSTLFTRQIPQIGIMKAIGARSTAIGGLYLAMTLVVAVGATALSVVPGIVGGRLLANQIMAMLAVRPESLAPEPWTFLVVGGAGLVLPVTMTVVPLVRAASTTVRRAMDHHGGATPSPPAVGGLTRLTRLRGLDRTVLLSVRNLVRRPTRLILATTLLAGAGTVFVAGLSLSDGMAAVAEEQQAARTWDVEAQLTTAVELDAARSAVSSVDGVARVDGLRTVSASIATAGSVPVTRTYPDQGHGRMTLVAAPPAPSSFRAPPVRSGRWLAEGETGSVALSATARDANVPGTDVGGTVQLHVDGHVSDWRVVGIVDDNGGGLYTTAAGLAAATGGRPGQVNVLRVTTSAHDEPSRTAVAAAVDRALAAAGVDVRSVASVSVANASSEGHMGPLVTILLAIATAMGVVGGIGLAATMGANILDRTRELGVLRAIGASPRSVRRMVLAEGLLLGLASCAIAALPALVLTGLLGNGLGDLFLDRPLPYRVSLSAAGIWVLLAVVGSTLATEAAASRAARIPIREALAHV